MVLDVLIIIYYISIILSGILILTVNYFDGASKTSEFFKDIELAFIPLLNTFMGGFLVTVILMNFFNNN